MKKTVSLIILLVFVLYDIAAGAGFSTLGFGAGARVPAMGFAYAAIAKGGTAGFYNPAAVSFEKKSAFVLSTFKWVDNLTGAFAGWTKSNGKSGFSVFVLFSNINNIEYRTVPSPDPISTFSFYEAVTGVSYSRLISRELSFGISVKSYYEKIFIHESAGVGFDAGLMWRPEKFPVIIGAAVQNMGRVSELNQEKIELPLSARIGAALPFDLSGLKVTVTIDAVAEKDAPARLQSGAEVFINNRLFVRCGYQTGRDMFGFTAGAGLVWKKYTFNYAYVPYLNQWHDMHRFSIEIFL